MVSAVTRAKRHKKAATTNKLGMGAEPGCNVNITEDNQHVFADALNWYSYAREADDNKTAVLDYLRHSGYPADRVKKIARLDKNVFPPSVGTVGTLLTRMWTLPKSTMDRFVAKIAVLDAAAMALSPVVVELATVKTKPQAPWIKWRELIDLELDKLLENENHTYGLYTQLEIEKPSAGAIDMVRDWLQGLQDDFDLPGYETTPKAKLKKWREFNQTMIDDCVRYTQNKKVVKAPRKKKVVTSDRLVAKLKFSPGFAPLKLVSVTPQTIVGAKQLWVYNTKYRKLTVYNASSEMGLSVKGSAITGFDTTTSETRMLRKPDFAIKGLLEAGKITLRSFMSGLTSKGSIPNGRINTDTVLLRVVAK